MPLSPPARFAMRQLGTPAGWRLDARVVSLSGHSPYSFLFSRHLGRPYRAPMALTTIGSRSGRLHTIAISYQVHDGAVTVVGSAGGSPREPHWLRNLRADPVAWVRIRRRATPVRATILQGEDKHPLWEEICASAPIFAEYEERSGRDVPVVVLHAYDGGAIAGAT